MEFHESRELPLDVLIFEVLTRTSLPTLGKCRLVSNDWNHITYNSTFMQLHYEKTQTLSGYFMQSITNNKYSTEFVQMEKSNSVSGLSLDFLPDPVKIEASSNQGLLFCLSQEPQSVQNPGIPRYYVCKPSTKQWTLIPNPKTRYITARFAMMVLRLEPLHYKIVRFSWPKFCFQMKNMHLRCEIFDSETWAWKQSKEVQLPYGEMWSLYKPVVHASGAIHWLTGHNCIFKFNVNEENWRVFPLPEPLHENDNYNDKKLVEYEGKLAIICMGKEEDDIELWVMEDYRNQVWNIRQTLSTEILRREGIYSFPMTIYNADTALIKGNYNEMIVYNFQTCSYSVIKMIKKHMEYSIAAFAFRSDLEPTNLMGRRRS